MRITTLMHFTSWTPICWAGSSRVIVHSYCLCKIAEIHTSNSCSACSTTASAAFWRHLIWALSGSCWVDLEAASFSTHARICAIDKRHFPWCLSNGGSCERTPGEDFGRKSESRPREKIQPTCDANIYTETNQDDRCAMQQSNVCDRPWKVSQSVDAWLAVHCCSADAVHQFEKSKLIAALLNVHDKFLSVPSCWWHSQWEVTNLLHTFAISRAGAMPALSVGSYRILANPIGADAFTACANIRQLCCVAQTVTGMNLSAQRCSLRGITRCTLTCWMPASGIESGLKAM